ncbi:MAG: tetratricopeptide repeat protein [Kiritimatiellae bacterium]|nr:tetratricopeptide repeat protein [Kiritimatiellia bacterium]
MKGSKLIGIVVGIMLVAAMSFADVTNDYRAAMRMFTNKQYVAAHVAFANVIKDYPAAPVVVLANAQMCVGSALKMQKGKDVEAQAAFKQAIKDYPAAPIDLLVKIAGLVAHQFTMQGKYAEAQAAYEQIVKDYPTASVTYKAMIQRSLGTVLFQQKKYAEAQGVFDKAVKTYPTAPAPLLSAIQSENYKALKAMGNNSAANTVLANLIVFDASKLNISGDMLLKNFNLLVPSQMTAESYTAALQDILKVTPATEANATFLSRVKSEYEKMK